MPATEGDGRPSGAGRWVPPRQEHLQSGTHLPPHRRSPSIQRPPAALTHTPHPHTHWLQIPDRPDVPQLQGWQASSKVHLLNLAYDLMPPDCVSVVVTEMGAVPPTSVAVILREAQRDSLL